MTAFKILLVDDEKPFVEALAQRLRHKRFRVHCAFCGSEALNRLEIDDTIDVVVLDLKMPGLDGIETVKAIKKNHPLVETIMLTGHATIHSAVDSVKLGAVDYLTKPCDIHDLVFKITQAATRKRNRETQLFNAKTKPYISDRERNELIDSILNGNNER